MCAPLYTSEKVSGRNPKWTKMDICSSIGSVKGIEILDFIKLLYFNFITIIT